MKDNKWIPCSEKLPEKTGWYQCSTENLVLDLYFNANKKLWIDNRRKDIINVYKIYGWGNKDYIHELTLEELRWEWDWTELVIAWQPLPKIYKEEGDEL